MLIRAKYYGTNDLLISHSLQRAEEVINTFSLTCSNRDINDILEYYNILLFFDNKLYLPSWDEKRIKEYTQTVNLFRAIIGRFLNSIQGENLSFLYQQTDKRLKSDFIAILAKYEVTKRITKEQFTQFINDEPDAINFIVCERELIEKYNQVIADYLSNNIKCAELVIKHYFVKNESHYTNTFMPDELNREQQEKIIRAYVNWDSANLNYLRLISGLKKTGDYPISDEVKLLAYRKVINYQKEFFKNGNATIRFSAEIEFHDQKEPILINYKESEKEHIAQYSYNKQWFSENLDFPTLLNNFIFLFFYVDSYYCCQFLSNPHFLSIIERTMGLHTNNEYFTGVGFKCVQNLSTLQMTAYRAILKQYNIEIEELYKWFFEDYLKKEFGVENYLYFVPSANANYLEKILLIASQLDAVLKQFRLYINNGTIDRELFEFSSAIYKIVDTPSMIEKKYLYPNSNAINRVLYYLFSDQCMLSYTEKTIDKYDSFIKLLANEDIKVEDYPKYDQVELKWLIEIGIIFEDKNGFLRMEYSLYEILLALHLNGCIAFSYCSKREKQLIDEMIKRGDLVVKSSLFTKQEQDYLDYMLNVQKFYNGPEIRNKYVHGNFSQDTQIHEKNYIELLKIMTLIVLKINEEFCLKYPSNKNTMVVVP